VAPSVDKADIVVDARTGLFEIVDVLIVEFMIVWAFIQQE
jgi:hypothetical protein